MLKHYFENHHLSYYLSKKNEIFISNKGKLVDNSPIESWHSLPEKEAFYTDAITLLSQYIIEIENWLEFYNTEKIRNKKK